MTSQCKDEELVVAVDPGKDKCGLAVVEASGTVLWHAIVPRSEAATVAGQLVAKHSASQVVVGDATTSVAFGAELQAITPGIEVVRIDERNSTLEGRSLYWTLNPPRGWRRLLPVSLLSPPVAVDDYAAIVLARRFLGR